MPSTYDPLAPLPILRTQAGDVRNPFHHLARYHRALARPLAVAFRSAMNEDEVFATIRAVADALCRPLFELVEVREKHPAFLAPDGQRLPFDVVHACAVLYIGTADVAAGRGARGLSAGERDLVLTQHARHFTSIDRLAAIRHGEVRDA